MGSCKKQYLFWMIPGCVWIFTLKLHIMITCQWWRVAYIQFYCSRRCEGRVWGIWRPLAAKQNDSPFLYGCSSEPVLTFCIDGTICSDRFWGFCIAPPTALWLAPTFIYVSVILIVSSNTELEMLFKGSTWMISPVGWFHGAGGVVLRPTTRRRRITWSSLLSPPQRCGGGAAW